MFRFGVVTCVALLAACESHPNVDWAAGTPRVPAPVAGVDLAPEHERVTVSWTANAAEEAVESYVVYSASESWIVWSVPLENAERSDSLSCCSFTLDELPNEEAHWFSVAAINDVGEGLAGIPISVVPPGWGGTIQGGTISSDFASGITVGPSGDLYAVGSTSESLDGEAPQGGSDVYVVRFRTNGQRVWTRLIGTPADENSAAASVDDAGNVFLAGTTTGAFPGETALGMGDVFFAKLDTDGGVVWLHQTGTTGTDTVSGAATLGTSAACFVGSTNGDLDGEDNNGGFDAFVTLYDSTGTRQWTRLVGTAVEDIGNAAAFGANSGRCYVSGYTSGALQGSNLGGKDAFVAEYLSNGGQTWIRQFGGVSDQRAFGLAVDDTRDRVYVSGDTLASFGGQTLSGPSDPFVVAYDRSGGIIDWTRFVGGTGGESPSETALCADGSLVAAYYAFQEVTSADIIVVGLSTAGDVSWTTAIGTGSLDYFGGVSADDYRNSYVTGYTMGSLGGANAGDWDYFVAKVGPDGIVK